jgi:hypothetical protein
VADLGLPNHATTKEIYNRAGELGLELCPAEVGPYLRLALADTHTFTVSCKIAMELVAGNQYVFNLYSHKDELVLGVLGVTPDVEWLSSNRFVFRRRTKKTA